MSRPKRFDVGMTEETCPTMGISRWPWVYPCEQGEYVLHTDYAALAAENERLKALVESNLNAAKRVLGQSDALRIERDALAAEVERLRSVAQDNKAETEETRLQNERLRKAGDAMAFNYEQMASHDGVYSSDLMKFVQAWLAAKGVQP